MIVKELILALQKLDQNKEVVISADEEGNGYHSIDAQTVTEYGKSVIISPFEEYISDDRVFTKKELGGQDD
jgi:hypothetical protein